jgi:hypothetical protein
MARIQNWLKLLTHVVIGVQARSYLQMGGLTNPILTF